MSELLLHSARELTENEAGGHGNRWGVFTPDVGAFVERWLRPAIEGGEVAVLGIEDEASNRVLVDNGEPSMVALLYTGQPRGESRSGMMALIHTDPGGPGREARNEFWSAYPFLGDGLEMEAWIEQVDLHPNRVEARLQLGLAAGGAIDAFDPLFFQHRAVYRAEELYRFSVAGLAYRMAPTPPREQVIDDPHQIRRWHARGAWVKTHGQWTRDDEEASLAAWQPASPEDLEPIRIDMSHMAALLPASSGPGDDASYIGEVVRVVPRALRMFDVDFWRVDTVVLRADDDVALPIYVAERLFEGDWRPAVGQYVEGSLWLQAHLVGRVRPQ